MPRFVVWLFAAFGPSIGIWGFVGVAMATIAVMVMLMGAGNTILFIGGLLVLCRLAE
ncbi:MAG: hypothetical protein UZ22_OP11002000226 [Microgenomates bacterium OLB23]|nr:MAG: hypothetical protein UZ22_OP11002000226 [Microgenomates bacterium OLB23]